MGNVWNGHSILLTKMNPKLTLALNVSEKVVMVSN